MNKKFITKVVLATALVGGVNFLPISNFEVGNVQISVAYAESKNFAAKEAAMTDVEIIEAQAKEASRMRAIEALKEKIAAYVRNYGGAKGKVNEDDVAAIAEKYEEVGETQYKKLFYNAVDGEGKELGKVGIMYEATVTAKFNSKKITEYIKLTEEEKARRIRQARESREKFEELDREYEELRKNARTKTPEQLQSEIKDFDDKLSDLEKRREKNRTAKIDKPVKQDKPKTQKNKIQSMKFSQPVQIGELSLPPMGFFEIKKSDYNNGTPCTVKDYSGMGLYAKGIARFGNGDDALYFHYDANNGHNNGMVSRFGSQDFKNTVEYFPGIPTIVWKIKTNVGQTFYILEHGNAAGFGINHVIIGKNKDGKFVKYLDTSEIKRRYFEKTNARMVSNEWNKFSFQENTIIIRYGKYAKYNIFNAEGEFRFKWDEAAKWFGVEKITYNQNPVQENKPVIKPVTNQPVNLSQPVKIGTIVASNIGGFAFRDGNIANNGSLSPYGRRNAYDTGVAKFTSDSDELYFHYKMSDWQKKIQGYMNFGDKNISNTVKVNLMFANVFKIIGNNNLKFYLIHDGYDLPEEFIYTLIGKNSQGKWVKYFDTGTVGINYFGNGGKNSTSSFGNNGIQWGLAFYKPEIKNNMIIIHYDRNRRGEPLGRNNADERGEFRFKWDEKAQWFSVEQVKY